MKTAIVTGASRGIGLAIAECLLDNGYLVYGISRTASPLVSRENFRQIDCNLLDTDLLTQAADQIKSSESSIDLLVNNAGIGAFGPHEQIPVTTLQQMIRLNLEAPILLCRLFLRELKQAKGHIINVSSVTAKKVSTHGCAYAATKAGLSHFSESLFEEVRKSGVKVTVLQPDMTASAFYDEQDFTYVDEKDLVIQPKQIRDALEYILKASEFLNVQELTIRPQRNQIQRKPHD